MTSDERAIIESCHKKISASLRTLINFVPLRVNDGAKAAVNDITVELWKIEKLING